MNGTDNQATMTVPGYESLADVLQRAYDQAAKGKGADRHAGARPFTEQPMQSISALLGTPDGLLYQAMKKIQESKRLDRDARIRELLGAINYLAGTVIFIEAQAPVQAKIDFGMPIVRVDGPRQPGGGIWPEGVSICGQQIGQNETQIALNTAGDMQVKV